MQDPINTPRAFFEKIVVLDCEEALAAPNDVRKVFHACMALSHMRDWLFHGGQTGFGQFSQYCEELQKRCPSFKAITDIALNAKHFVPKSAPHMDIGVSAARGSWDSSWGNNWGGAWGRMESQALAKAKDGQPQWVIPEIKTALQFWQEELHER